MTTSAAENLAGRAGEKKDEKVEKRRALGRGLESLLPGPRVVKGPEYPVPGAQSSGPQGLKPESSSAVSGTAEAVPFPSSTEQTASEEMDATRAGAPAPHLPEEVISIQAVADDRILGNRVAHVAIELIEKNPYQTRYVFDEEMLGELRDSIKEHGVVQPVVVRPADEEGRYILVLGERRLRASKMAGKETIPALVRRLSPQQAAEMTVLENVMREDLNPIEQAEAFRVLSLEFKLTQTQIADRIGMSRETVSNYMRLLRLPQKVMEYMLADRLSFSDAREILRLENDDYIEEVAEEVVTHKLKWDQIEDRVMRINGSFPLLPGQTLPGEPRKKSGARWMDPNVRAAQTDMERTLGMRVRIRDRHGKGKIVIEYASVDDYERVVEVLRGKKK
ncbi:MAG TPA: ParB/RepB/Spo0J family partition protein [Candidatus Dormibacteraeota bacterium]|nr:ParB/RepB/Spo0J family partition protein [Candidatus Dormibacteraeota bacterium]